MFVSYKRWSRLTWSAWLCFTCSKKLLFILLALRYPITNGNLVLLLVKHLWYASTIYCNIIVYACLAQKIESAWAFLLIGKVHVIPSKSVYILCLLGYHSWLDPVCSIHVFSGKASMTKLVYKIIVCEPFLLLSSRPFFDSFYNYVELDCMLYSRFAKFE